MIHLRACSMLFLFCYLQFTNKTCHVLASFYLASPRPTIKKFFVFFIQYPVLEDSDCPGSVRCPPTLRNIWVWGVIECWDQRKATVWCSNTRGFPTAMWVPRLQWWILTNCRSSAWWTMSRPSQGKLKQSGRSWTPPGRRSSVCRWRAWTSWASAAWSWSSRMIQSLVLGKECWGMCLSTLTPHRVGGISVGWPRGMR